MSARRILGVDVVAQEQLIKKLGQIEDLARDTLAEHPVLAKERLRMIIALARYLKSEVSNDEGVPYDGDGAANDEPLRDSI
jgi:hypothetical protein